MGLNRNLPYTTAVNDMVFYAHQILVKLGIERCHWVGQSAGGVVGVALRVVNPARIQSITLASAPLLGQARFKLHAAVSTALLSGSRLGRRVIVSRCITELGYSTAEERSLLSSYLRLVFERTDPKTIAAMRPLDGVSVRRVFNKLRDNPPPLLVLCGKHDSVVLPRDQRTVAETTQALFVDLPCGHLTMLAEPEACAQAFRQFIETRHLHIDEPAPIAA